MNGCKERPHLLMQCTSSTAPFASFTVPLPYSLHTAHNIEFEIFLTVLMRSYDAQEALTCQMENSGWQSQLWGVLNVVMYLAHPRVMART